MRPLTTFILKKQIINSREKVLFPFYHSVTDTAPDYIKHLYQPRKIDVFKRDLDVLLELYTPISLLEYIDIVRLGKKLDKSYFHLTFDDGLSNFYEVIAPILIRKKIPATVFLNASFIDNKELFYRHKASILIEKFIHSDDKTRRIFQEFINKQRSKKSNVINYLLEISYNQREVLNILAESVGVSFIEYLENEKPYLTTVQVQNLIGNGFTFGAHSIDHPSYKEISLNSQIVQTKISVESVIDKFKLNYKAFAFPFEDTTVSKSFYKSIGDAVDVSFGTSGIMKDTIKNNYQRIPIEQGFNKLEYYLFIKYLKYQIKYLIGNREMNRD